MSDTNKLYDLMNKMYSEMQSGFSSANSCPDTVEGRLTKLENEVSSFNDYFKRIDDDLK